MPPRLLFVTRKFPPSIGGMETQAAGVWAAVEEHLPGSILVAHGGPNRELFRWLPVAWWRTVRAVLGRRVDLVLTGDALTFVAMWPLLAALRVRTATLVVGLDLTWRPWLYQRAVRAIVARAGLVIANSDATAEVARQAGVPAERLRVVRLGVEVPEVTGESRAAARAELHRRLGLPPDAVVVTTVGRLVRRKGAHWFVTEVLAKLDQRVHYVLAGCGPEREAIASAAAEAGLSDRVRLVGQVDDPTREVLMQGADLFVQPNVPVAADMEGFGLVVIESALRATPVVASALEGIRDAVVDGESGILCPPGDAERWHAVLDGLLADLPALAEQGWRFREVAAGLYSHERMAQALLAALG